MITHFYASALFRRTISQNVSQALEEDLGQGDLHDTLYPRQQTCQATVITREPAIMCGQAWVTETFRQIDPDVRIDWQHQDGQQIQANHQICSILGATSSILSGERTALNFLQLLMGTATTTYRLQQQLNETHTRLLDTRKTIPGLRLAQKYAVHIGGGVNHRIGLWDAFLIKENHITAAGSIKSAVDKARSAHPNIFLEIEVENIDEFQQALATNPDRILLDNFSLEDLRQAVKIRAQHSVQLEASGNVTEASLATVAATGVDFISMGAITKHVRAIDLSLRINSVL